MIRLMPLFVSFVLTLELSDRTAAASRPEAYACASRSDIVGSCFEIRGRLSFWNGAPSARIWPVGTKRMLGVHSDVLPPSLESQIRRFDPQGGFDTEAWATLTVCPFGKAKAGHMQFVCIESWRNLSMRRREK